MSTVDTMIDNPIWHKLISFIGSLLERKLLFSIYTVLEKWILLHLIVTKQLLVDQNVLIVIFGKDLVMLVLLGLISFEKIKIEVNK